jgi:hypothetical protein
MKEFDNPLQTKPVQVIEAEQEKHYHYAGSIKVKPGHQLFSVNIFTHEVRICVIKRANDIDIKGNIVNRTKTQLDHKLFYCSALNEANALKKFKKIYR